MNKKIALLTVIVLVAVVAIIGISSYLPGEGERAGVSDINGNIVKVDGEEVAVSKDSVLEFEGYAPGKSHVGTFDNWEGSLIMDDGEIVGIEGAVYADSVDTGIDKLNTHLKSDDFFDAVRYPVINFASKSIDKEKQEVIGELTFRGVTKEITFPAEISNNEIEAEFFIDVTPFNFKYVGINKEVRVKFDLFA